MQKVGQREILRGLCAAVSIAFSGKPRTGLASTFKCKVRARLLSSKLPALTWVLSARLFMVCDIFLGVRLNIRLLSVRLGWIP